MTACGCHPTYGAHLRAKNFHIGYCQSAKNFDKTRANRIEHELSEYANARAQGIQPSGTSLKQTRFALDASDRLGVAFNADQVL